MTFARTAPQATFTVTDTNDTGAGSLRQAILDANANQGADTIAFNIASGSTTITPASPLPEIRDAVTIDGSTQPGFAGAPIIEINGERANGEGLLITAGNSVVRGLVINRFKNSALRFANNGNNRVEGNFIGTDVTGAKALGNGLGIRISAVDCVIGGTEPNARNVIVDSQLDGIEASNPRHRIQGNLIGVLSNGAAAGNRRDGIVVRTLGGVSIRIIDNDGRGTTRQAPLFFVSPGQINFQIPPGTASGVARLAVIAGSQVFGDVLGSGPIQVAAVAPGLFAANADGQGVAAALAPRIKADGMQNFEPVAVFDQAQNRFVASPIDLGPDMGNASDQVFLILFGTGLRYRSALANVSAAIGGVNAEVQFAGAQGGFVGLDQVNLRLPRSLAGRGDIEINLTVEGATANRVRVNIK